DDLLGPAQAAGEDAPAHLAGAVELPGVDPLPRRLLVPAGGPAPGARGDARAVGAALPELRGGRAAGGQRGESARPGSMKKLWLWIGVPLGVLLLGAVVISYAVADRAARERGQVIATDEP